MKYLFAALICMVGSANAFAASNVVGTILSSGDLSIQIVDDPSTSPRDGAILWDALLGTTNDKRVVTPQFSIKCQTRVMAPIPERFGNCKIRIAKSKVRHSNGKYGAIFGDAEGIEILRAFFGGEDPSNPIVNHVSLANGEILITADHAIKTFGVLIDEDRVN